MAYDQTDAAAYAEELNANFLEPEAAAAFLDNDDVADFMELHAVDKGFECAIFKSVKSPTSGTVLRAHQITYTDMIPGAEPIVQQFGSGEYEWQIVSKKKKSERTGVGSIVVKRVFLGPHWDKMHRIFQRAEKKREREKRREDMEDEMEDRRLFGETGMGAGLNIEKVLELVLRPQQPAAPPVTDPMTLLVLTKAMDQKQGFNWQALAAIVGSLAPAALPALQKLFQPAPHVPHPMDKLTEQIVSQVLENKLENLNPPEKEDPWYVGVLAGLADSLPTILSTLKAVPEVARGTVANAAIKSYPKGTELFEALKNDPEALADTVRKWDQIYNPADVDMLLKSAGLRRPPSTVRQAPAAEAPAGGGGEPAAGEGAGEGWKDATGAPQ